MAAGEESLVVWTNGAFGAGKTAVAVAVDACVATSSGERLAEQIDATIDTPHELAGRILGLARAHAAVRA